MKQADAPTATRRWGLMVVALALALAAAPARAEVKVREVHRKCALGRDYFLYLPEVIDPAKVYRLVVGVHHYKATGAGAYGLWGWVKDRDCIAVGPTFPSDGYQLLAKDSDRQLIGIYETLRKEFRLHPKMFLYGFSGGAQFTHRFALKHLDLVAAVAAHSGGSWDLGEEYGGAAADKVLFVASCGENDNGKAGPNAPYGRAEYCRKFAERLRRGGFYFKSGIWPGEGHGASGGSWTLTHELWYLMTTGLHPSERESLERLFQEAEKRKAANDFCGAREVLDKIEKEFAPRDGEQAVPDGWHVNPRLRIALRQEGWKSFIAPKIEAARAKLKSQQKP